MLVMLVRFYLFILFYFIYFLFAFIFLFVFIPIGRLLYFSVLAFVYMLYWRAPLSFVKRPI